MFFLQYHTPVHKCSREQAFFTTYLSPISIAIPFFLFPGDIIFVTFCTFSFTFYWKMKIIAPNLIFLFTFGIYFMNNNRNLTENTFRLYGSWYRGTEFLWHFSNCHHKSANNQYLVSSMLLKFMYCFLEVFLLFHELKGQTLGTLPFII